MNTLLLIAMLSLRASATDFTSDPPAVAGAQTPEAQSGIAAVYSGKLTGHLMANGQKYDPSRLIAAHKSLPFGTRIEVTNPKNGKQVQVTITDRGPRQAGRVLDLSPQAARALGIRVNSLAQVTFHVVPGGQ